jgi:FkbM family methyltransferase
MLLQRSPWPGPPWERDEQDVMRQLVAPGDTVFDVGGHLGLHTAHLSQLVGPSGVVHVFEPNPRRHLQLAWTAASCGNVTLHRFGLSDCDGRVALFVPPPLDDSMASLEDWTEGRVGAVDRVACDVRRLDPMLAAGELPQPNFVKCDVEGAERRVFEGARSIFDRADAPIVLFEANARSAKAFGESMSSAAEWLAGVGAPAYRFFHVQPHGTLVPIAPTLSDEHDHFNLVAVPANRADRLP